MYAMFYNASSFNQPIGSWNVSKVTNMSGMFYGDRLSTYNYDILLEGWSSRPESKFVNFDAGSSQYNQCSELSRNILIDTYSWVITDGGDNVTSDQCP